VVDVVVGEVNRWAGDGTVIVGGGVAALAAAQALRGFGCAGAIRMLSAEPVLPYERPALSKSFLANADGRKNGLADHEDLPPALCTVEALAEQEIELERGAEVVSLDPIDRVVTTADGRRIGYRKLLLATGARSRRLDLGREGLSGVHHLREVNEARALRDALRAGGRIAIVGGGVIGLEVAAVARQLGCDVTVVEAGDRVMARVVPADISEQVAALHRARGVALAIGERPIALTDAHGHVTGVELAGRRVVRADAVVIGIGAVPNTDLAERAGLFIDGGIVVDEQFRTSDPDIFAAGDVVRVPHETGRCLLRTESWRPAQEQGRLAAAAMMGVAEPYREAPWMWSDQYDASIQATGFGFDGAELIVRGGVDERTGLLCLAVRDTHLVGAYGISHGPGIGKAILAAQLLIQHGCQIDVANLRANVHDAKSLIRHLLDRKRDLRRNGSQGPPAPLRR